MLSLTPLFGEQGPPIEAEVIAPDRLKGLTLDDIHRLPVMDGNQTKTLGDLFKIEGSPTEGMVTIVGDARRVKRLGEKMGDGTLHVEGAVGMHVGARMTGGTIVVDGDADDWAAAEMAGGSIHLRGRAGDMLACAYPGAKVGMTGGLVLVDGAVGEQAGRALRGGTIAIKGNAGDALGTSMIAGTILVGGAAGRRFGAGMKRGSIVVRGDRMDEWTIPPTFRETSRSSAVWLRFWLNELSKLGWTLSDWSRPWHAELFAGDFLQKGRGEIVVVRFRDS